MGRAKNINQFNKKVSNNSNEIVVPFHIFLT